MGPFMALELVRSCEPFATEGPAADKRPLSCVPAEVGPQVGCLAVDFSTAGDVTDVLLLFRWVSPLKRKSQ